MVLGIVPMKESAVQEALNALEATFKPALAAASGVQRKTALQVTDGTAEETLKQQLAEV